MDYVKVKVFSNRYKDVESLKEIVLEKGNLEPFLDHFHNKFVPIKVKKRKSGVFGVFALKEQGNLVIKRNDKQPKPNQDKDFRETLELAKRFGFKIRNRKNRS